LPGREFVFSRWASVSPAAGWEIGAASFLGDQRDDLLGYHRGNGTLWVGRNTGTVFTFTGAWATVQPVDGWQFATGDVTGNGRADVVGYHPSNGTIWLGENTGSSFQLKQWATLTPAEGWKIAVGYFTGKARADLFAYHINSGTLWIGENAGSRFIFTKAWAQVEPAQGWQFATGDFTGNGRTDVVGYHPDNGSVWVGENLGSVLDLKQWATLEPADGWRIEAGLFTGRAKADLLGYHSGSGTLWVGENAGSAFVFTEQWATVTPSGNWQFVAGSANGDIWSDVIGYHPSNGTIWVGESSLRPIEGYCWPLSAAPGEEISFRLSGEGQSIAQFRRHTSTSSTVDSFPMDSVSFTSIHQMVPASPWRSGCNWNETFRLSVPLDWPSGIYSAACKDPAGNSCDIAFVVKPAHDKRSPIAVIANVNTWLAYNGWGGKSKYTGLARTSFLRPMPGAAPGGASHLTRGELWILGWLESQGHTPDVYTDIDFHNQGCDAEQYRCLILSTHPEYWTTQMYDNLKTYLDAGGSVAYLGGNGIFEDGEYDNDQAEMVFRLGIEGGNRVNALFRKISRPERSVLGVATERCGVVGSPYEVLSADHALFAGTGLTNGATFGNSGVNTGYGNGKASAWEVDTSNGAGATSLPSACALEPEPIPPSTLPPGLVVLAAGIPDASRPGADMTYYNHPGGGFVFAAGSITFGGSLVVDSVMSKLIRNVLKLAGIS
jgi:hypothetical protein